IRKRFEGLFAGPAQAPAAEARAWQEAVREHAGERTAELQARIDALLNRLMRTREGERCVFKAERLLARPELYRRGSDDAFPRWLAFLEQIGNRNSLYSLMEAHAGAVAWASHIFAEGGKHAPLLIRHPEFLESYLDLASAPAEPFARRFQAILRGARDEEEFILDVQMAKARALMQILTAYLEVGEQAGHRRMLSDLADATVAVCAGLAWRQVAARLGEPTAGAGASVAAAGELPGFAVLAMGKLGSQELRFGSDLDLVFVYGEDGGTTRGRSHMEFYTKVGQRLSSLLTSPTQFGALQELDHRLRPFGAKGVLVPSLAAYASFLQEAEVWNYQAFTRIRPVCGDMALARRLIAAIGQAWQARRADPVQTARAVRGMLGRLVAQNAPRRRGDRPEREAPLQLKYAVGGLIGFEFLRQCAFLLARATPGGDWTPPEDHAIISRLLPAYHTLGALDERVSFYLEPYRHEVHPQDFQRIAAVRERWDYQTVVRLCQELESQVEEGFSALTS
ncbi:MAG TPA: hypothetical protein VL359_11695, partial [bacterium]|nr:hypothetical protein [bacterium]